MRNLSITLLITSLCALSADANSPSIAEPADTVSIISSLNSPESTIIVNQPQSMNQRVSYGSKVVVEAEKPTSTGKSYRQSGFRIQIFSDNNVRTAKSNAEYRKRTVEQRIPGMRAYLKYESPYWRVQVGDFRSRSEAESAMHELREAFPTYASDLKIVSERVNITQ